MPPLRHWPSSCYSLAAMHVQCTWYRGVHDMGRTATHGHGATLLCASMSLQRGSTAMGCNSLQLQRAILYMRRDSQVSFLWRELLPSSKWCGHTLQSEQLTRPYQTSGRRRLCRADARSACVTLLLAWQGATAVASPRCTAAVPGLGVSSAGLAGGAATGAGGSGCVSGAVFLVRPGMWAIWRGGVRDNGEFFRCKSADLS